MEQNHELPSSFQETERCFYVCGGGCGRVAFRHTYFLLTHFFVRTSHFASMLRNFWLCNCPGETSSNFPTTRLLHWRSIMTMTYPFPVSGDEFKGKRVLVTGGTKGMGQAMVRRFALSAASVATTARSPLPEGQAVALFVQTDIGTAAGVQEVISRVQEEWGGLDILVNNVGGSDAPNGGYKALSDDDWQRALNVNLLASVRLDRAFLPGMIERKSGVILHISSIQHRLPLYDATLAYAAAKGALN